MRNLAFMKNFAKASFLGFAIKVFSAGVSYLFFIYTARILDTEEYGLMVSLLSFSTFSAIFVSLGQNQAILRFFPRFSSVDKNFMDFEFFKKSGLHVAAFFTFFSLSFSFLQIKFNFFGVSPVTIFVLILLIFFLAISELLASLLRAKGKLVLALLPKSVLWKLTSLIFLFFYFSLSQSVLLESVIYILCFFIIFVFIIQLIFSFREIKLKKLDDAHYPSYRINLNGEWKKSIIPFWIHSIANNIAGSLDTILVAIMLGVDQAGMYFVANRVALVISLVEQSSNIVTGPYVAKFKEQGGSDKLNQLAQQSVFFLLLLATPLTAVLMYAGEEILYIFGESYIEAFGVLLILLIGRLIAFSFGSAELVLTLAGKETQSMYLSLLSIFITSSLIVILAVNFGSKGAASGLVLGIVIRKLCFCSMCRLYLGVNTDIYSIIKQRALR